MSTFAEDPLTKIRGHCSVCGTGISSATALYCIHCAHKYSFKCPVCMERGKLTYRYQNHKGVPLPYSQQGKKPADFCVRCEQIHDQFTYRQLKCAHCNNDRVVFLPPQEKKNASP